ncbi:MAG: hydantoinase/oxoprolinase N-terminal domain-containing protein, partial [Pseudomonadota bacterium]
MKLLGVDVGGTFTDMIFADPASGEMGIQKVSTTPDDPSRGVIHGLTSLIAQGGISPEHLGQVFHGTTTATNAVLEAKGARVGMITNDGFRDIIHIGRHQRVEHYSIMQEIPWQTRPLIERR